MVRHVGDRQVRNRGTIGGSLMQADPTGEMPLACLTLGASVRVAGPWVAGDPGRGTLRGLVRHRARPPRAADHSGVPPGLRQVAFAEQCRRHNDFAVVAVACAGDRRADGRFDRVRIGLGGVHDTPVVARRASEVASGTGLVDADIAAAASAALEDIDPPSDIRASAEYRRQLVPIYVRRVLRELNAMGTRIEPAKGLTMRLHEEFQVDESVGAVWRFLDAPNRWRRACQGWKKCIWSTPITSMCGPPRASGRCRPPSTPRSPGSSVCPTS